MGHDRYDVIIVGAGPAGSSAAKLCAENNLSVALIERGQFPGIVKINHVLITAHPVYIPGLARNKKLK